MGFEGLVLSTLSISESIILGTEDESESESKEEVELPELSELLEPSERIDGFMDKDSETLCGTVDNDTLKLLCGPTDNNTLESLCGPTVIDTLDPDDKLKSTYILSAFVRCKGVWLICNCSIFTSPFLSVVLFVVVSNPSWLVFEVLVFEVEVVARSSPLHDLYVLVDVPFGVVPFLLDTVTDDRRCCQREHVDVCIL
jgi:hypothetical protein